MASVAVDLIQENHFQLKHKQITAVHANPPLHQQMAIIFGALALQSIALNVAAVHKQTTSIFSVATKPAMKAQIVKDITVKPADRKTVKVSGKAIAKQKMIPSKFDLPKKSAEVSVKSNSDRVEIEKKAQSKFDLNTEVMKKVFLKDLKKYQAYTDDTGARVPGAPKDTPHGGDIFLQFLAIVRRMYNQTQDDARELYQEVKQRTDQIQLLTDLVGELNKVKGPVDWSNDPVLKTKLDYAIDHCGLKWEKGKYTLSDEEKLFFKENVRDRKENMEKIDKLKQMRMQQLFHDSSENAQWMSNILKMCHDTKSHVIQNFRNS